jgi:hypothetical protein
LEPFNYYQQGMHKRQCQQYPPRHKYVHGIAVRAIQRESAIVIGGGFMISGKKN